MTDFLNAMAHASRERAREAKVRLPRREVRARLTDLPPAPRLALDHSGFDLIAEVKRRSPSEGMLHESRGVQTESIAKRARQYAASGAAAISVLTEPTAFDGSMADLLEGVAAVDVPVMRKDFLVDDHQLYEARIAGAGGVLLIARIMDEPMLVDMPLLARELGLFVLLEAFDARDLDRIGTVLADQLVGPSREPSGGPPILVGLNSRDLTSLEVDRRRFEILIDAFPPGAVRVAESGIETPAHTEHVAGLGYRLGLVGTTLMRAEDPSGLVADLLAAGRGAVAS